GLGLWTLGFGLWALGFGARSWAASGLTRTTSAVTHRIRPAGVRAEAPGLRNCEAGEHVTSVTVNIAGPKRERTPTPTSPKPKVQSPRPRWAQGRRPRACRLRLLHRDPPSWRAEIHRRAEGHGVAHRVGVEGRDGAREPAVEHQILRRHPRDAAAQVRA